MSKHVIYDWSDYLIKGDEPDWIDAYREHCEINEMPVERLDADFDGELFEQALNKVWAGWTENAHGSFDDATDDLIERIREEYELKGDVDPDAVQKFALGCSGWDLEDEIANLNAVNVNARGILCVASLGLWNGRRTGWKVINSTDVSKCLSVVDNGDWLEIYTKDSELIIKESHHDGTNYYYFYAINCDPDELEELLYNGADESGLEEKNLITPLGDAVNKFYGWED